MHWLRNAHRNLRYFLLRVLAINLKGCCRLDSLPGETKKTVILINELTKVCIMDHVEDSKKEVVDPGGGEINLDMRS